MKIKLIAASLAALLSMQANAAEKGITNDTILLGQSAPTTGPLGPTLLDYVDGASLYFEHVNKTGGINGRKIKLITLDDGFDPARTAVNTKELIEKRNVFAMFAPIGNANILGVMPLLKAEKIPTFGPVTGAEVLRDNNNRYMFHIRASFNEEIEKMVQQLVTTGALDIGVAYQDDGYGQAVIKAVKEALARRNLAPVAYGAFDMKTLDMSEAVKAINKANPRAIILGTSGKGAITFIKELRKSNDRSQIYALSLVGSQALIKVLGPQSHGIVVAQVMPSPWRSTDPIVREYQLMHAERGTQEFSYLNLEGFIAAKVFVEGLRKAGKNPTRESFIAGLESMKNTNMGGFRVRYGPGKRSGSSFVDLSIISAAGKFIL